MNAKLIGMTLAQRLQTAEQAIASAQGHFVLFALVEREEPYGKWDLLVSAAWLNTDRQGVQQMVDLLKPYLIDSDWLALASITPLEPSLGYVQWIAQEYNVQHHSLEVIDAFWDSLFIPHGYIITADPSATSIVPTAKELVTA